MNQRIAPRKALATRVVFEDELGADFLYFTSTDISASGLFIQNTLPFRLGTRVFLKFSLFEGDEPIHVAAEVMRFMQKKRGPGRRKDVLKGIGLKFLGLSDKDFARIRRFMAG